MKVLVGSQIREADRFTMLAEPIASVDLMERASAAIAGWMTRHVEKCRPLLFLVGKGNNGGDGLAVARMLCEKGHACSVCALFPPEEMTDETRTNWERLPGGVERVTLDRLDSLAPDAVIVDALLGTGVKGMLREPFVSLVRRLNALPQQVVAIDIPSGMKTEYGNDPQLIVHADRTLAIEFPKLSMLLPEAGGCCGEMVVIPIGLSAGFIASADTPYVYITKNEMLPLLKGRARFSHKGDYGHALLVCGSKRMMGAALLAVGGALRSGCALVTAHVPESASLALFSSFPSAMLSPEPADCFSSLPDRLDKYRAIGVGCGWGMAEETADAFGRLLQQVAVPMVIDADALNILSMHHDWLERVPPCSILTPHPGELRRLVGEWSGDEEKLEKVKELACRLRSVVVVKGAYTMIVFPDGKVCFNSTGNAGMAKGGSGDVLTGFIAGLLARGYASEEAAVLGVYFHGLAGDKAAGKFGPESMNSRHILDELAIGNP